ncbi:MAG: hypothetical protein KF752_20225 [Pirellulaceae bacterium]|nr:hypothetical protein [Pirellulaceae bacterium]
MPPEEYIAAKRKTGCRLHEHDGVWWETTRWGYCKPALPFQELVPGVTKPRLSEAFIGYTHRVSEAYPASGHWHALLMQAETIANWTVEHSVDSKRRNLIRKGLKLNEVRVIEDIEPYRDSFSQIAISTAIRNQRGYPAEYYRDQNDEWWESMRAVASYSEVWGAFHQDTLAAYFSIQVAGQRAVIDGAKSATESLNVCPNDALLCTFLQSCRQRSIEEIWYGHWSLDKPSLNQFKQSFGFEDVRVPYCRKMLGGLTSMPHWLGGLLRAS